MIFSAAFMLLYNASTFAAQISNEFFYNQFYTETGIGSRVSFESTNPQIPNIDAISGALFILRIQYEYAQTQCDEGARDDIDIWYMGII